jgi:alkylhydroperoxidase family enzyme
MPRIAVPPECDPMTYVWGSMAPALTSAAGAFSHAVYADSSLGLREFEAARITIARINDCAICQSWRTARDVPSWNADPDAVPEEFYANVGTDPEWSGFTDRERLAAEFADRYARDHLAMDEAFWARLHAQFDDEELVDLALCVSAWLGLGRFNQVFQIDQACRVP